MTGREQGVTGSVVVTGASTGIGHATARLLARRGIHVFGSVRRQDDADRLRDELGAGYTPLLFDVSDEQGVARAAQLVAQRLAGRTLLGLVNNAGMATPGPLLHQPLEEFRRQIEVNLIGPQIVTQAFLPLLGAGPAAPRGGRPGRVVNVGSVGGRFAVPFIGAYVASKHALEGWSDSLRCELLPYGIDVVLVAPGSIRTPIWAKSQTVDLTRYDGTVYARALRRMGGVVRLLERSGYPPERVAEVIWRALVARWPRTRYAVVPRRLVSWTVPSRLPRRVVDWVTALVLGLRRGQGLGARGQQRDEIKD